MADLYHEGSRELQDRFDTRRIADRLTQVTLRAEFSSADRDFIERQPMFFLATADAHGRPDCSYKGGLPGFVRVAAPDTLAFPSYDGNGMFKSLGNLRGQSAGCHAVHRLRAAEAPAGERGRRAEFRRSPYA